MGNASRKALNLKKGQLGNFYDAPERVGPNPFTRSGVSPPKLTPKAGSNEPSHRVHDPMSLELHMADERVRARGLSPAEREWRRQYLKDQHLHPDEPIHVDAVHRQLNPIRRLYRWPWDTFYVRFLRPNFGTMTGSVIRVIVPKTLFAIFFLQFLYYLWKYEDKDWQRKSGTGTFRERFLLSNRDKINAEIPELVELGLPDVAKYQYLHPSYSKRTAMIDVGETQRPW